MVTHYGGVVGAAAATGVGSHQRHHVRHYAKAAKGKQTKRKESTAPKAPTNASMKAAVDKHVSDRARGYAPHDRPTD